MKSALRLLLIVAIAAVGINALVASFYPSEPDPRIRPVTATPKPPVKPWGAPLPLNVMNQDEVHRMAGELGKLQKGGLIIGMPTCDWPACTIFVNPDWWYRFDYPKKQIAVRIVQAWHEARTGDAAQVFVRDQQSGQTIARFKTTGDLIE